MEQMKATHVKKDEIVLSFQDGFAMTEVLAGTYEGGVRVYRCALQAGCSVKPQIQKDTLQILCLTDGVGAVTTPVKAFAVNEVSVFIPDPSSEYAIHAGTDMVYTMFEVEQKPGDLARYEDFHLAVPCLKPLSQCTEYVQNTCKTKRCRSFSIIPTKRLCRVLAGACITSGDKEGTFEKGHPAVAQWNVAFGKKTVQTVDVQGQIFTHRDGDVSYIPAGLDHSLYTEGDNSASYIWFEHYVLEKDYLVSYPRADK